MGLEAIAAPMVAAAGNMAGGYAASKLMGNTQYPKGGGINGLTSANTGKSGISPAVQINPSQALQYFQQAADQYSGNAKQGLDYYNSAVTNAINSLGTSVTQANNQLGNIAYMGSAAQNQYLKMLGLDTPSPTANYGSQFSSLGSNYSDVAKQVAAAENIQDPAQRQAAIDNINKSFQQAQQAQEYLQAQNYNAAQAALPTQASIAQQAQQAAAHFYDMQPGDPNRATIENAANAYGAAIPQSQRGAYNPNDPLGITAYYTSLLTKQAQEQAGSIQQQYSAANSTSTKAQGIMDQYLQNYNVSNPTNFGYSGSQIAQKIQDANPWLGTYASQTNALIGNEGNLITKIGQQADALSQQFQGQLIPDLTKPTADNLSQRPGYQFSLQQGQEGVMRAAAAAGMLSSGNTLAAMDQYSQGLAQQVYQSEYNNYLNSVSTNNSILANIGATQNNASSLISNIYGNEAQQQSGVASAYSTASNNYMTNLFNAMTQGNNAISQQSANIYNTGTNIAGLQQGQGSAALQTYQGIGQALYNSSTNQGNTWNQDMLANMEAQNAMIMQSNSLKTQAGIASGQQNISGGYLGLQQLNTLNNLANQTGQAKSLSNYIGRGLLG